MKIEELILGRCIKNINPYTHEWEDLDIDKYYVVEEIDVGQYRSSVMVNGKKYNSIYFKYFNDRLQEIYIYHSKYSPYIKKVIKNE